MYTGRYPGGLRWRHDAGGEGPPTPAPRQGRTRAHPRRVTAAVPRSGHQPHRHGPALRGGPGVEAHGVSALHQQGRTRRRIPAPVRSRRDARSVRPHRPHAPRTTPRRLRGARGRDTGHHAPVPLHRGGRRDPRPSTSRIPVRTRLQEGHRRAAHRSRRRSRRHEPRTTTRTTGPAARPRRGPPPRPQPPKRTPRDGASARTRVLNSESFPTAAAIAAVLIDSAIPSPSPRQPSGT